MRTRKWAAWAVGIGGVAFAAATLGAGCRGPAREPTGEGEKAGEAESLAGTIPRSPPPSPATSPSPASPAAGPVDPGPVRTEDIPVPGDLPAVVVRGAKEHRMPMLFLAGMCVHPGGYVMAFQHTAASRGDLVAVQGDVSCGGDGSMRRWSGDLEAMDRRIEAAFRAAGLDAPRGVTVIGYSQGAERAEKLAARWPERYSAAILMAGPVKPTPARLARTRAVVLMAGSHDAQEKMRSAVSSFETVGIPSTFFELPNARHGSMGDAPEASMTAALDFIEEQQRAL